MEEKKDLLSICSYPFCRKIRIRDKPELWLDKGEEPALYNLFMYKKRLSHTFCPSCYGRVMSEVEELLKK